MIQKTLFMFGIAVLEVLAAGILLLQGGNEVTTQVEPVTESPSVVIFEDRQRIAYCLIGAMCGAFVSVAIFPPQEGEKSLVRGMGAKFGCSAIGGIILTPKAVYYAGWDPNADNLITASFFVATIAVSLLHTVLPLLEKRVIGIVEKKVE